MELKNTEEVIIALLESNKLINNLIDEMSGVINYVNKQYKKYENEEENPYEVEYQLTGMVFEEKEKIKELIKVFRNRYKEEQGVYYETKI